MPVLSSSLVKSQFVEMPCSQQADTEHAKCKEKNKRGWAKDTVVVCVNVVHNCSEGSQTVDLHQHLIYETKKTNPLIRAWGRVVSVFSSCVTACQSQAELETRL